MFSIWTLFPLFSFVSEGNESTLHMHTRLTYVILSENQKNVSERKVAGRQKYTYLSSQKESCPLEAYEHFELIQSGSIRK